MDQNQPQASYTPAQAPAPAPAPVTTSMPAATSSEHKKVGPIIAILVIVIVLIAAAIYLFASRVNKEQPVPSTTAMTNDTTPNDVPDNSAAVQQSVAPVTNTSDDVNTIQADLNASTNGLDGQNF